MNITQLETKIQKSYEEGITLEDAEKLAAEFLHAMMQISQQLKSLDLDARMKKAGLKSIKAATYLSIGLKYVAAFIDLSPAFFIRSQQKLKLQQ
jgi:hypothetical protein